MLMSLKVVTAGNHHGSEGEQADYAREYLTRTRSEGLRRGLVCAFVCLSFVCLFPNKRVIGKKERHE